MRFPFFRRAVDPSHKLDTLILKEVEKNLAARTFTHVTPVGNVDRILAEGLQTRYGGSDRGLSGVDAGFSANSKDFIHLGKDDDSWMFRFVPPLKPSNFYTRIFDANDLPNYTLIVILPNQRVFSEAEAALQVQMRKASPLFAPSKTVMPLIESGQVKKDFTDPLPGRYKTGDVPAEFVFFKPLKDVLRKPGVIGVDECVSTAVLDTLVLAELSGDAKREYLRAVVHCTTESLYPVKP